jgi:hypothetical protein
MISIYKDMPLIKKVDVRREGGGIVSQFSDVLGEDTRIPDGVKASISTTNQRNRERRTFASCLQIGT